MNAAGSVKYAFSSVRVMVSQLAQPVPKHHRAVRIAQVHRTNYAAGHRVHVRRARLRFRLQADGRANGSLPGAALPAAQQESRKEIMGFVRDFSEVYKPRPVGAT